MSDAIERDEVKRVLLPDGWYAVTSASFEARPFDLAVPIGDGFTFVTPTGERISGPMSSLLAVEIS